MRRLARATAFLFAFLLPCAPGFAQGTSSPPNDARALRELLDEVRLLRQVLQATSLVSVRANILLARQQAEQERIGQIERQITDAQNMSREAESQVTQFADYAARAEESLASETDPATRAEKEEQMRQYDMVRVQVKRSIETQRAREAELTTSLSEEQAKLEQIQRGLDVIQNDLEALQKKVPGGGQ